MDKNIANLRNALRETTADMKAAGFEYKPKSGDFASDRSKAVTIISEEYRKTVESCFGGELCDDVLGGYDIADEMMEGKCGEELIDDICSHVAPEYREEVDSGEKGADVSYKIEYWHDDEAREEGFGELLITEFDDLELAKAAARKLVDRDGMASVEVLADDGNGSVKVIWGYDGIKTWAESLNSDADGLDEELGDVEENKILPTITFISRDDALQYIMADDEYPQDVDGEYSFEDGSIDWDSLSDSRDRFEHSELKRFEDNGIGVTDFEEELLDSIYNFNEETKRQADGLWSTDSEQSRSDSALLGGIALKVAPIGDYGKMIACENEGNFDSLSKETRDHQIKRFTDYLLSLVNEYGVGVHSANWGNRAKDESKPASGKSPKKAKGSKISEGYLGQTLRDFLSACLDTDGISNIIIHVKDREEPVYEGKVYDIPSAILDAEFMEFGTAGSKPLKVNVSESPSWDDYYEFLDEFLGDANVDDVVVWDADSESTIYSGDVYGVPEEALQKNFAGFYVDGPLWVNLDCDEGDLRLDEAGKHAKRKTPAIHVNANAGNPERNMARFNAAMGASDYLGGGCCEGGLGESRSEGKEDVKTLRADKPAVAEGKGMRQSPSKSSFGERRNALLKAFNLIKKKGCYAVIYSFNQSNGGGIIYLNPPLCKDSWDEVQNFANSFRRGNQSTKVTVGVLLKSQVDDIDTFDELIGEEAKTEGNAGTDYVGNAKIVDDKDKLPKVGEPYGHKGDVVVSVTKVRNKDGYDIYEVTTQEKDAKDKGLGDNIDVAKWSFAVKSPIAEATRKTKKHARESATTCDERWHGGFVKRYKGYKIIDVGDYFVVTDPHGLTIGHERTLSGCEGLIDELTKDGPTSEKRVAGNEGLTSAARRNRKADSIFDRYYKELELKKDILLKHGLSQSEVDSLADSQGLGKHGLDAKLLELGLWDEFKSKVSESLAKGRYTVYYTSAPKGMKGIVVDFQSNASSPEEAKAEARKFLGRGYRILNVVDNGKVEEGVGKTIAKTFKGKKKVDEMTDAELRRMPEGTEKDCIDMLNSMIAYKWDRKETAKEFLDRIEGTYTYEYLKKYIDVLGKDKVAELMQRQIDDVDRIVHATTDSEGVNYNAIIWKDKKRESLKPRRFAECEATDKANEDTKKLKNGKWANVGKDGKVDSGTFRTKKEADAQRRAMFANGLGESYEDDVEVAGKAGANAAIDLYLYNHFGTDGVKAMHDYAKTYKEIWDIIHDSNKFDDFKAYLNNKAKLAKWANSAESESVNNVCEAKKNISKLDASGVQYFGTKNQFNYDKMQLRIDHDAKTYEKGMFTHIAKRETVSTPELHRIISRLDDMGYTEVKPESKDAGALKETEQGKKAVADKSDGWQKRAVELYLKNAKPAKLTPDQALDY